MLNRTLPISFNKLMIPHIISGAKVRTRRLISEVPEGVNLRELMAHSPDYLHSQCDFGAPPNLLWVREDHTLKYHEEEKVFEVSFRSPCGTISFHHQAESLFPSTVEMLLARKTLNTGRFVSGRYLPKGLARIWLLNRSVSVERLHDITEEEALLEGVEQYEDGLPFRNYATLKGLRPSDGVECLTAVSSFQTLWVKLHGIESWDKNPWVWVLSFSVASTTGRPSDDQIANLNSNLSKPRTQNQN